MVNTTFINLLEAGDINDLCEYLSINYPHLPKPDNPAEAEVILYIARTECEYVSFRKRAYAHAWLSERGLPSKLPDKLKPKAERLYPIFKDAVGISVNTGNEYFRPAFLQVRRAMEIAVEDIYANNDQDDIILVKRRMREAKADESRRLFGRLMKPG